MTDHDKWIAKVCDHLNKLIQLDFDAAKTYQLAIEHIDDASARADLKVFLNDHERHVMELTAIIRDLGGVPIDVHRDFKGFLLESVTKLRSHSTLGALRAMRSNERYTNRYYVRETEVYMPPIAIAMVMENLADERRHLAAIEAHIDRISGAPAYVERVDTQPDQRPYPPM